MTETQKLLIFRKECENVFKHQLVDSHAYITENLAEALFILIGRHLGDETDHSIPFGIPEILLPISDRLKQVHDTFPPAVYFLVLSDEVVYVGQSVMMHSRMKAHKKHKEFDRILYLECPEGKLTVVEATFINAIKPRFNMELQRYKNFGDGTIESAMEALLK